jgi:hypothetical protein
MLVVQDRLLASLLKKCKIKQNKKKQDSIGRSNKAKYKADYDCPVSLLINKVSELLESNDAASGYCRKVRAGSEAGRPARPPPPPVQHAAAM